MDLLDITLNAAGDRGPLQYVSGEALTRWQRIEAAARVVCNNRGGEGGASRQSLDALFAALGRNTD